MAGGEFRFGTASIYIAGLESIRPPGTSHKRVITWLRFQMAPAAQEERRRQVIGLRQSGVSYAAIAAQVGLSQTGVFDICQRFAAKGETGLVSGKRGRKPDEQKLLDATQEAAIKRLICRHMPDDLGLDFALWSREAVRALI